MKTRLLLAAVVLIGIAAPIHQNTFATASSSVNLMDGVCCGGDPDTAITRPLPAPAPKPAPAPTK